MFIFKEKSFLHRVDGVLEEKNLGSKELMELFKNLVNRGVGIS